jgi:predicted NACHT family NTPase
LLIAATVLHKQGKCCNQASRVLLHQWDVETKLLEDPQLKDLRISIDYKDKQGMLRKVAHHMQSSAKGLAENIISATDLENILTDYLRGIVEKGEPRMVARQMIYQLRHRNFILCYLGADSYAFVHRTFLEYFCAWEFVWQFKETQTLTVEQLKNEVFASHWQDESWHEVLRLISGMIDAKFVAEMIGYLLEQKIDRSAFLEYGMQKKEGLSNLILATNCFVEVRNKHEISSTSVQLMKALTNEIESQYPFKLNKETVITLAALVISIGQDSLETLQLLKNCTAFDSSLHVRKLSVQAIFKFWKNESDTLPWLKDRATLDQSISVRLTALQSIIKGWGNEPDTLPWLKEFIQYEKSKNARIAAVKAIAQICKDDPNILSWLNQCVQSNNHRHIRLAAVKAIVQIWKDDPNTLFIVKYCAQYDDNKDVRLTAIQAISQDWKDDINALSIIKHCVQYDKAKYVRLGGIEALAEGWKDYPLSEPEVLDLLLDRSKNDPDEQVRKFAEEQLVIWRSRSIS